MDNNRYISKNVALFYSVSKALMSEKKKAMNDKIVEYHCKTEKPLGLVQNMNTQNLLNHFCDEIRKNSYKNFEK